MRPTIKKIKTKFHKYAFCFDYDAELLRKVQKISAETEDWRDFNFNIENKAWIFTKVEVLNKLKEQLNPIIEEAVAKDFRALGEEKVKNDAYLAKLDQTLSDEDLELVDVNTKLPLFDFQKKVVDFVDRIGGKALIADDMGCLSGDTVIKVNRGGNCRDYTLEQAYKRFNGLENKRKNWRIDSYTRSLNEEEGEFKLNKIKKVLYKGKKKTIKIKTKTGKELILTPDHELFSDSKVWKAAGLFVVGDLIYINGRYKYWSDRKIKKSDGYVYLRGEKYKGNPRITTSGLLEHVYLMEEFLGRKLKEGEQIHHKNGIRHDNRIENLEVLTTREHLYKKHKCHKHFQDVFIPKLDEIIEVTESGLEEVYDIIMENPHRNFIANGVIVHNCGKTIEAIGYAVYKKYSNVLVIVPASLKENWRREIEKFSGIEANVVATTEKVTDGWNIIGYPNIVKYYKKLRKDYDLIIIDEAHYIKNKKAQRSKKTMCLLKKTKDALFLTGTPILNRPLEIYNIFNFIRPMPFWGEGGFALTFCGAKQGSFGWDLNGATNLDVLKKQMTFMIRRTKEEVIEELPDKTITIIETKLENRAKYNSIIKDFRGFLKDNNLNENAIFAEALTKVSYLKQEVVKQKMKSVNEQIDNFLESGKKILLFTQYKGVADYFNFKYKESVKLTGDTPEADRQKAVDDFQNKPEVKIFVSTIKAGGVGLTLTEADTVVFTDLSWTPADHHQAEDRAYRIGQKNNVNVYYMITPETVEEEIWKLFRRKEVMVNKIMEGQEKVRKVHIKTLLKNI